jgi:5-methylcytosine-specific restriction enzyme B
MVPDEPPSAEAREVLRLLRDHHNVLITGAPGTGKTRLLAEVRQAFGLKTGLEYTPHNAIPIPKTGGEAAEWLPSPERSDRQTWTIDFHQGTKYRDFVRGIEPKPGTESVTFHVRDGVCWRANQHALGSDGTALVLIDEINRGPAVQIFGDLIVAIETDKRLLPDDTPGPQTHFFPVISDDGTLEEIALSHHLYIVAAMNQADTSVEPLDVAFLRRFAPYRLQPDPQVILSLFNLTSYGAQPLPPVAGSPADVFAAAFRAWQAVNERIALGRGREFCLGHGVLLQGPGEPGDAKTVPAALAYASEGLNVIRAHVEEVFFGDLRAIAEVWSIGAHNPAHPWRVRDRIFAGEPRVELIDPPPADAAELYALLRAIAEPNADDA